MHRKILFILNSCVMGGATISFLNLAKGLCGQGCKIVVVVPTNDVCFRDKIKEIGGSCYVGTITGSFYYDKKLYGNAWIGYFRILLSILKTFIKKVVSFIHLFIIICKEKPDIIHTNVGVIQEGFLIAKLLKIPHVWHLREYQDLDFNFHILPNKRLFCEMLRKSYVLTITDDIRSYFGLNKSRRAKTIYNGILHKGDVLSVFPKKHFFLCASRISVEKGHEETIRVFSEFHKRHNDFRLVILGFGENEYIDKLKQLANRLGCASSIDWVGYTNSVTQYMKDAYALLVNSHFEGFGRMTAEACFCNCMVIGRDTGGTKEILQRTGGMLYSSSEEMYGCMEQLITMSTDEYLARVNHACNIAKECYSIEGNVEQTSRFYDDIINGIV